MSRTVGYAKNLKGFAPTGATYYINNLIFTVMYKTTLKEIREAIKRGAMLSLKGWQEWQEQHKGQAFYLRQQAYSCGQCGCTGQVHEIMWRCAEIGQFVSIGKVGVIGGEIYMV